MIRSLKFLDNSRKLVLTKMQFFVTFAKIISTSARKYNLSLQSLLHLYHISVVGSYRASYLLYVPEQNLSNVRCSRVTTNIFIQKFILKIAMVILCRRYL